MTFGRSSIGLRFSSVAMVDLSRFDGHPRRGRTSRSDAGNSFSGRSRATALAGGGEGFFPRHRRKVPPNAKILSPMCPNSCFTYVVGIYPGARPRHWKSEFLSIDVLTQNHMKQSMSRQRNIKWIITTTKVLESLWVTLKKELVQPAN
jgi:hypothetical protein